jgi:hypothetical protein
MRRLLIEHVIETRLHNRDVKACRETDKND